MHTDDLEAQVLVLVVPVDHVRDGALAVDARVRPEIDQNDLAAQRLQVDRSATGCVQPTGDALDIGCGAAAFELLRTVAAVRQLAVLFVDQAAEVELLLDLVGRDDLVLQAARVVGDGSLQFGGHVEHQRDREHQHHDAADDANATLMTPEGADPFGNPLTGQREEQQRKRGADGERDRQRHGVEADGARRTGDDDRGEHRPAHGHIQHTECESQPETASALAHLKLGNAAERLLQNLLESGEDQPEADDGQCDEAGPPDRVLRKMQK